MKNIFNKFVKLMSNPITIVLYIIAFAVGFTVMIADIWYNIGTGRYSVNAAIVMTIGLIVVGATLEFVVYVGYTDLIKDASSKEDR